uniref:Hypothetical conserved protein n=1 Tax=Acetithermum autotrophicum TaxID=1446466 RepID=H5SR29_ACEAU|nr:hypothetical conserved protein [Candidatus Acetothermum autotrophicum]
MYELRFHPQVDKELETLPKTVRAVVKNLCFPKIAHSPWDAGKSLSGALKKFHVFVFSHKRVSYRIAYEIDKKSQVVFILMVGKREGFYERLRRRLLR